jgi:hypothetical protein
MRAHERLKGRVKGQTFGEDEERATQQRRKPGRHCLLSFSLLMPPSGGTAAGAG